MAKSEMDKSTLKALLGSIRKWEKIVSGKGEDKEDENCPLCIMFLDDECTGCPVKLATASGCKDSPYKEWSFHFHIDHRGDSKKVICPECKILAIKELKFLISLLPDEAKKKYKASKGGK